MSPEKKRYRVKLDSDEFGVPAYYVWHNKNKLCLKVHNKGDMYFDRSTCKQLHGIAFFYCKAN